MIDRKNRLFAALLALVMLSMPLSGCAARETERCDVLASTAPVRAMTAALLAEKPAIVYVPIEELERLDAGLDWGETELCAVLPRIFRTADEPVLRQLLERHPEATAVAVGNLGHLPIAEGLELPLRGDLGMNVFNSRALLFLRDLHASDK